MKLTLNILVCWWMIGQDVIDLAVGQLHKFTNSCCWSLQQVVALCGSRGGK